MAVCSVFPCSVFCSVAVGERLGIRVFDRRRVGEHPDVHTGHQKEQNAEECGQQFAHHLACGLVRHIKVVHFRGLEL